MKGEQEPHLVLLYFVKLGSLSSNAASQMCIVVSVYLEGFLLLSLNI